MPKLHQYKTRNNNYVLTSINGSVITFQLTEQGERKLKEAGIAPDQNFPRALLLDLWRSGDAFTGGSGVGEPVHESTNQLDLDFPQDPDPETLFPSCDDCGSVEDLHLSIIREQGGRAAKLQCPLHRDVTSYLLEACMPLRLMDLSLLSRLFEMKSPLTKKYEGLNRLENLLRSEFESKWEELRKLRGASQRALFETDLSDELRLSHFKEKS